MQIFNELSENFDLSLALGYFDGVHLGHQAVIQSSVDFAKANGRKSAVVTFKDHPCCYFYGVCPKYILTRQEREQRIADLGVDYLYELDFDESLCHLDAEEYLSEILVKNFRPIGISTGFNHNFGAKKSGNVEFLKKNEQKYCYKHFEVSSVMLDDEVISSTAIRNLLINGDIEKANSMLGQKFSIMGEVVEGQKLGQKLGFRTANLIYPPELVDIPFGVYETIVDGKKSITNFGIRPTVSIEKRAVLETHILNFDEDMYGEIITVQFTRMIRKEEKFNSIAELKNQIQKDIEKINCLQSYVVGYNNTLEDKT